MPVEVTIKDLIELIEALAWPCSALIAILLMRKQLKILFEVIISRATKISGGGLSVDLAVNQVQSERLIESSTPEDKARDLRNLEIAKAIAPKFDYWMKNYNHPSGVTDYQELLDWLTHDKGARYVSRDYNIFTSLAEVLSKMGYDTIPAPTEGEFMVKIMKADEREEHI